MAQQHSGFFIQGGFGNKGNFEAVAPGRTTGLLHIWRNNDASNLPWSPPATVATGTYESSSLIQSTLGSGLRLDAVARSGSQLIQVSRDDTPALTWLSPAPIAAGVNGNPALIQSTFGEAGNYELVVPLVSGGIGHFWRDNDDPAFPWHGPTVFGTQTVEIGGVSLIQGTFGDPGNLEVVATAGNLSNRSLVHFWRDVNGWHGPTQIFLPNAFGNFAPSGIPGFIQSKDGNFQVVVPSGGELVHLMRDNSDAAFTWNPVARFAGFPMTGFLAASLIQSNFGPPESGNFELLSRKRDAGPAQIHVQHHWRTADTSGTWQPSGGDLLGPF